MKPHIIIAALLLPTTLDGTAKAYDEDSSTRVVKINDSTSDRGWLGVSIQDMTPRLARSMDVKTDEGALVNDVMEDSPAKSAGILAEDIIVEFNGRNIYDADDLMRAVRKTEPAKEVDVVLMRKGEKKSLRVTLGKYPHRDKSYSYSFRAPRAPRIHIFGSHTMYGMQLSELNKQLGEYFGTPNGRGVLVEEVEAKSKAAEAGFMAGDVIIKAGEETVKDIEDIYDGLAHYKDGDKVNFEIVRKGSKRTLSLVIEENRHYGFFNFQCKPGRKWFEGQFFIPEDLERLQDEIRVQLEVVRPDLEQLESKLKRVGKELEEHFHDLRDRIKTKTQKVRSITS